MELKPVLKPGGSCVVTFEGEEVAIFNVEGRFYGIANRCPHRSGPISHGHLETVPGTVAIRCPLHGWLFDLKSGACLNQPHASTTVFCVTCEDGNFLITPTQPSEK